MASKGYRHDKRKLGYTWIHLCRADTLNTEWNRTSINNDVFVIMLMTRMLIPEFLIIVYLNISGFPITLYHHDSCVWLCADNLIFFPCQKYRHSRQGCIVAHQPQRYMWLVCILVSQLKAQTCLQPNIFMPEKTLNFMVTLFWKFI
jgi:hypothetical protein